MPKRYPFRYFIQHISGARFFPTFLVDGSWVIVASIKVLLAGAARFTRGRALARRYRRDGQMARPGSDCSGTCSRFRLAI